MKDNEETRTQDEETKEMNEMAIMKGKVDILKNRLFVNSPQFQGLDSLNENLSFSVVSYNLMAEQETEIGGIGSGFGRRLADSSNGRGGKDQFPREYKERIKFELFYLQPDIFFLQSITMASRFWYNLERTLNP